MDFPVFRSKHLSDAFEGSLLNGAIAFGKYFNLMFSSGSSKRPA
jgi:hypothetical protein